MAKKTYSTFNLFLRAAVFLAYMCVTVPIYSVICLVSLLAPLRTRHALIRLFLVVTLFVLEKVCLIKYRVRGLSNVPKDRVGIVLSKHQSTWETFYLPLVFHDPAILAKRELVWVPFFGWGLAGTDPILINRSSKSSAMQQIIKEGRRCLEDDRWILIFPEGTRIPYGEVGVYKLGGTRLAVETGYPVIPIAHNAGRFWPKRKFIKQPGTIDIVIGPMIESKGRKPEDLMREVSTWIEETIKEIDSSPR